ncbi:MAG TPA: hypothetical protein VJN18_32575 [Polyangiaceae bacterium]|nr:hypothetical protein [Polyangiaceae bacterium]
MSVVQEALASSRLDGETRVLELALPTMALSLWAPWAWAILYACKDIENRSRRPEGKPGGWGFPRHFVGEFWLHCSLWPARGRKPLGERGFEELADEFASVRDIYQKVGIKRDDLPSTTLRTLDAMRGHIVGRVTVTGYVEQSESPWFVPGSLGLVLADPFQLVTPVAASGALGWWRVPDDKLALLKGAA